jgi:cyclohexanecarboxylate-CoA ligase
VSPAIRTERLQSAWAQRYRDTGSWPAVAIGDALQATCAGRERAAALIEDDRSIGFAELEGRVRRLAAGLAGLGVGPGDTVAYQLPNWWEAAAALLASLTVGACAVPIVPILRARELRFILAETRPRAIFLPQEYRGTDYTAQLEEALAGLDSPRPHVIVTRGVADGTRARNEAAPGRLAFETVVATKPHAEMSSVDPDSLAVIIYTSGSTATPKGAMHTHNTLTAEIRSLVAAHGLGPDDRVLMPSPLTHVSGVVHGILAPAILGTSAVLMDRWDPTAGLTLIERHRVTYLIGAPTFLQQMLADPAIGRYDLSSLRLCSCGGAAVTPELMRLGRELVPLLVTKRSYGSSEFPTIATTTASDALARGEDSEGRPLAGVEIRLTDETGRAALPGAEGEIRARGPDCFVGYADPSLDAECFDDDGFYRTGDLGVVEADGYLRVTGRVKDTIVRKGEKFSAREVEDLIAEHPAVAEVAVVPLSDAQTGERACACVRLKRGGEPPDLAALVAFLRARDLTPQKLPEQLEVVGDFPRLPSGKINKRVLRETIERTSSGRR